KRQEGASAHPETAERVAWTESRNLSVADPVLATGVMIATARQADELKAAAGGRNTGRKASAGAVFAFSLGLQPCGGAGVGQADELKAGAGVRNTGRKASAGAVFAFSLGWHPSEAEGLDKAEMLRAADHALKVLKLDDRQALIVAHRDTAHPHVHVIVNRVCP